MSDVKVELEDLREESELGVPLALPPARRSRLWMYTSAALVPALLAVIAVSLTLGSFSGSRERTVHLIRSSIPPPANWSFEHSSFAISPDGTRLAFVAVGPDGIDRLWVRALSASNAEQIDGTDGALLPFWSPDSRRVGFFAAAS